MSPIATIRQARLQQAASAHRSPPSDWEGAVIRLAEERVWHYRQLIETIRKEKISSGEVRNGGGNR